MKRQYEDIDDLILSYTAGQIDEESFCRLKQWTKESDEHLAYVRSRLEVWFSAGVTDTSLDFNAQQAFERFERRCARRSFRKKRIAYQTLLKVAAVILLLLMPLAGYWKGKDAVKQKFAEIVIEAPLGATTRLILPDGSVVYLNAGSQIAYSQGFGLDGRTLRLQGEGYFEVAHNETLPFHVLTDEMNLRVIGTKFNFRNYKDDEEAAITLMEGKVAVSNRMFPSAPEWFLKPNESVTMNKRTGIMKKMTKNTEASNAWSRNELMFDEELLSDIAKQLTRSFNVQVTVADSLKNRRFYGSFTITGNTIEKVLSTMSETRQMNFKIENGNYLIY